jgi:hypothetical protein
MFPRKLSKLEQDWLFYLLPSHRKGYNEYRKLIEGMRVIGEGRFGEGNYVLGCEGDKPDLSYSSTPVFACGQVICEATADLRGAESKRERRSGSDERRGNPTNKTIIQISIHEHYDNKIEYSINNLLGESIPENLAEVERWSYSYWKPGAPSPFENDKLHEYQLSRDKDKLVLAVSPANRSIWLYDSKTEINHIIPVTNFINELLRLKRIINKKEGMDLDYIFSNLNAFDTKDFKNAFLEYNKHWHKVDVL